MGHGLQNPGDLQFPFDPQSGWTRRTDGKFNGFNEESSRALYPVGGHEGIDWACPIGTPIHAMAAGSVKETRRCETDNSSDSGSYGNFVRIHTGGEVQNRTEGFEVRYAHLSEVYVYAGQEVVQGQLIGLSGNTGRSTGPHLHVHFKPFGVLTENENNPHGLVRPGDTSPSTWQGQTMILGCIDFSTYLPANGSNGFILWKVPAAGHPYAELQTAQRLKAEPATNGQEVGPTPAASGIRHALIGRNRATAPTWWQIVAPGNGIGWVPASQVETSGALSDVIETWPPPGDFIVSVSRKSASLSLNFRDSPTTEGNIPLGQITDQVWRRVWKQVCRSQERQSDGRLYAWYQIQVANNELSARAAHLGRAGYTTGWVREDVVVEKAAAKPLLRGLTDAVRVFEDPAYGGEAPFLGYLMHFEPYHINGQRTNSPTWWRIPYGTGHGWVRNSDVQTEGDVSGVPVIPAPGAPPVSTTTRYLRLRSWVTGLFLRTGPAQAFPAYRLLTDTSVWYEVVGQSAATPVWYKIQYDSTFRGWVHSSYIELTERTIVIPAVTSPAMPADPAPGGGSSPEAVTTSGSAAGDYRNLVTNPDGRWAVWKSGTRVTANFSSPRSPVQYYARQNPQPQFVLPVGFRPTSTVTREVTGTRVNEDRTPVPDAPSATFTLRFETDGEMRYVNNSQVDHLGYVSYQVTHLEWDTDEELVVTDQPGTLSGNGTFINQQNHVGSSWTLTRSRGGTRVTGTISCTRSPVDHYANGNPGRDSVLVLPEDFRPASDVSITVEDAVRVNEDGSDSTDTRRVDFDMTMQSDGYLWYDRDTSLTTAGVGYLRYSVDVSWDARPLVPTAPRNLETDDVEADEVELDWDRPQYDGGDAVDEYRVEVYRNGRWDVVEDGISRTRYDVEDLEPYTTYDFRVRARNRADWSEPSTAVTVTTPRETPGRPRSLQASATHERVTLTWSAPSGDVTVSGYRIERRVGSGSWRTRVYDTGETATGWEDTDVSASTSYSYRVRAHNHGVDGAWSSARSVTTAAEPTIPGQPTGLTVSPGMDSRLQLSWTAPSDTGGGLTGYRIERSPDETPRVWTDVATDTGSADLTWDEHDVVADTVYHYRVSARNSAGVGMASAEAEGRTRPQLQLAVTATYPLAAHAEPRVDSTVAAIFHLYEEDRTLDLVGQVPGNNGWWRVLLFGQASQGPFWLPAVAGTVSGNTSALPQPPSNPESFTAALASGAVSLSWAAPASGSAVTGYRLWRQEGDGAFAQLGSDLAATVTTYTDSAVQNDHVYRYWLQALSDEGPGVPTTTLALAVMAVPVVPAAVSTVTATATITTLQLGWAQAATGGLPTGYRVAWRESGMADDFQESTATGTAYTLTDLDPDTTYDLQVTAFNQEGAATATTGTGTTLPAVPGEPTGLTAAPTADTQMTLAWEAPAYPGAQPLAGYRIERAADAATLDWRDAVADTGNTDPTWSDSGLDAATTYRYRVSARNSVGVGDASASAEGRTRPQAALAAAATYPLTAHQWPEATAPETHSWPQHDAAVQLDIAARDAGGSWYRVLRFGQGADGPYWLPAAAVTVTGSTTDVPAAPAAPTDLAAAPSADSQMELTWTAPATGGAAMGYRIERSPDADPLEWTELVSDTGTADTTWSDATGLAADTVYHYRVTARSGAEWGVPSASTAGTTRPQLSLKATTTYGLNVRSGPGTSHAIMGSIAGGSTTRYDILGKDAATAVWYQIRFSSTLTGWVHGDYVQTHGDLAGLAVTWTPGPQLSLKATTTYGLNVRSGPGTSHAIVGSIAGGSTTRYDILGKDAATPVWWQIQFSATVTGWVHGDYVQTHGDLGSVPIR